MKNRVTMKAGYCQPKILNLKTQRVSKECIQKRIDILEHMLKPKSSNCVINPKTNQIYWSPQSSSIREKMNPKVFYYPMKDELKILELKEELKQARNQLENFKNQKFTKPL
jgi:hypothetical protein